MEDQKPEVIYSLETMKENRNEVLKIFNDLKGKFLNGSFTLNDLVRDYNYSVQSAHFIIDTLARNGMINGTQSPNPNSIRYQLVNKKENQIQNILLWKKRSEMELEFFSLAIHVIEDEIKNTVNNLKIV
jgi:hypothetical protein